MTKTEKEPTDHRPSEHLLTDDLIAARAYGKWQARGCPLWDDERDWFDARSELEHELVAAVEKAVADRAA